LTVARELLLAAVLRAILALLTAALRALFLAAAGAGIGRGNRQREEAEGHGEHKDGLHGVLFLVFVCFVSGIAGPVAGKSVSFVERDGIQAAE
jgi:small-conductance mechanosensitive channel